MRQIDNIEINRKYILLTVIFLVGMPLLGVFGIEDLIDGQYLIGVTECFLAVSLLFCTAFLRKNKTAKKIQWSARFTLFLFACIVLEIYTIENNNFGTLLWIFLFPLFCFFLLNSKEGLVWVCVFYLIIVLILGLPPGVFPVAALAPGQKLRLLVVLFLVCIMTYSFEKTRNNAFLHLE
ncbi:MAG: hypothetical protein GY710_03765 [Desulfobacteraceae bacterium]|nr:hypothetical protein [Desulfobacteraceae bacterium]